MVLGILPRIMLYGQMQTAKNAFTKIRIRLHTVTYFILKWSASAARKLHFLRKNRDMKVLI